MKKWIGSLIAASLFVTGCATKPVAKYDYTEFEKSKPASILVTLPINNSNEINAPTSVLARMTLPLAEKATMYSLLH